MIGIGFEQAGECSVSDGTAEGVVKPWFSFGKIKIENFKEENARVMLLYLPLST